MPGLPRKEDDQRTGKQARVHNVGDLRWDGVTRGPELPQGYSWSPRTEQWWLTWRNSPQAMLMHDTDWEFMMETAFLHNQLWGTSMRVDKQGNFIDIGPTPAEAKGLAGEIRIRLEKLGATVKDRGTLGMKLGTSGSDVIKQAEEATKSGIDYRKRLEE